MVRRLGLDLFLDLLQVNMRNGVVAVEDARHLLKGVALGLDVEEIDEDQFAEVPEGVEKHKVPVVGQVVPGEHVGLVTQGKNGLDGEVHDHHTLGTELEGEDLEGVGDQQTGETNVVEDAEDPDKDNLRVARAAVGLAGIFIDGTGDGPAHEGADHACDGVSVDDGKDEFSRKGETYQKSQSGTEDDDRICRPARRRRP